MKVNDVRVSLKAKYIYIYTYDTEILNSMNYIHDK